MRRVTLVFLLLLLVLPQVTFAKEDEADLSSPSAAVAQYQLPYPGILPDSPLYPLKALRDRIILFLIADPLKKAEFTLLQADKRLASAEELVKRRIGRESLAESTASKGEKYFSQAVFAAKEAKKQGMDTVLLLRKLLLAASFHKKKLLELSISVRGDVGDRFVDLSKQAEKFETEL